MFESVGCELDGPQNIIINNTGARAFEINKYY